MKSLNMFCQHTVLGKKDWTQEEMKAVCFKFSSFPLYSSRVSGE